MRSAFKRHFNEKYVSNRTKIFTVQFEKYLAFTAIELENRGMGLTQHRFLQMANSALNDKKRRLGKSWFYGFLKRNKNLIKYNHLKYIAPGRKSDTLGEHIKRYSNILNAIRDSVHWNPNFIINADEIHFSTVRQISSQKIISSKDAQMPSVNRPSHSNSMTMIPFVSASGWVILMVYIMKHKGCGSKNFFHQDHISTRENRVLKRAYVWNDSGWLLIDIWRKIIDIFIRETKFYFNGQTGILIFDKLAAHLNIECVLKLMSNNFRTIFLPAKSTHLTQPLDGPPFANLKNNFETILLNTHLVNLSNSRPTSTLQEIVWKAEQSSFTKEAIL